MRSRPLRWPQSRWFAMAKLLLLSFVFATVAIPVRMSADKDPKRGLRKAMKWMIYFNLFYLFNLYYLQAHLN